MERFKCWCPSTFSPVVASQIAQHKEELAATASPYVSGELLNVGSIEVMCDCMIDSLLANYYPLMQFPQYQLADAMHYLPECSFGLTAELLVDAAMGECSTFCVSYLHCVLRI